MVLFYQTCEVLLIVALVSLVAVILYLVVSALRFKTAVIGHAKSLSDRPVNSVKSLAATGKAIVQQEKVRVQHMAGTFKGTAGDVKGTASEVKAAAQSVHPAELRAALTNVQHVFHFLAAAVQFSRSTANQGAAHVET